MRNKLSVNATSLKILFFFLFSMVPLACAAKDYNNEDVAVRAQVLDFFEIILLICSVVSIRQFFWPGENNHTGFQLFNAIYAIVFYIFAVVFIVHHKSFFVGFENLNDSECIKKYFLLTDPWILVKRLIIVALVINIIYIARNGKDYFRNG